MAMRDQAVILTADEKEAIARIILLFKEQKLNNLERESREWFDEMAAIFRKESSRRVANAIQYLEKLSNEEIDKMLKREGLLD